MGCEYTMDCNYPNQKLQLHQEYQKHAVDEDYLKKWQKTVNLMAKIFDVPAGLIMRVLPSQIEVLVSSQTQGNPHKPHETSNLNLGLYCETAMETGCMLQVPNALQDDKWINNPDVALNMISYLGIPLVWPDGHIFGTICVLDDMIREYSKLYQNLLHLFKESIENDFLIMQQRDDLISEIITRRQAEAEIRKLNEELEERVTERTAELEKKNAELQIMIDGFVGQELRMIEQKKKVFELKAKIMELENHG